MSFKIAAVAATAIGLLCGQAVAQNATLPHLANLQGLVYVDQGDGFVPASANTVLHPGDRVMTARGGVAKISYAGGCGEQVSGRSMAVIGGADCGGASARIVKADYQGDASGGGGGGFGGVSTTGLVIAGVALAGIVAVIVGAATDHGNNNGSSGGTSGGGGGPVSP
ncbi:hypothetical protein ACO2Q3_05435 [Caulobacter sp. KR2-114]|uniref:hypothetical protein n=1 Tax=Caulobacter sp. KR2-114 TaxID=3400912 RepID=UPI003BFF2EFD